MLIEFSVRNFKSFRDDTTFSMVAANLTSRDKTLDEENVACLPDGLRLLKSAAIYGANASGKSNLSAAMQFMRQFVVNSSKETQADEATGVEPFLLDERTAQAPSSFEMVFLLDGKRYRYGFEVTRERVTAEWLFYVPSTREARLFSRDMDIIEPGERFKEGKGLEPRTRKNALFLSVAAQFNGPIAQRVLSWFRNFNLITGLDDSACRMFTLHCFQNERYTSEIIQFVKKLDLGIDGISIEATEVDEDQLPAAMPEPLRRFILENAETAHTVRTSHMKVGADGQVSGTTTFDLHSHESEGTKKLFALAGPLIDTLHKGNPLFIDEFDARLHPLVTRALIELFNSRETNPNNAQLVFTTHDTNLLSNKLFRRDQVWFAEKDKTGGTHLYSLAEYRVRNDASFESDYIRGKYGAIPFLGDFRRLIGDFSAQ